MTVEDNIIKFAFKIIYSRTFLNCQWVFVLEYKKLTIYRSVHNIFVLKYLDARTLWRIL
jgi:hypothetical protein